MHRLDLAFCFFLPRYRTHVVAGLQNDCMSHGAEYFGRFSVFSYPIHI